MAVDSFSPVSLPPLAWVSNANPRDAQQQPAKEQKDRENSRVPEKLNRTPSPEVEFEKTVHELDSIA